MELLQQLEEILKVVKEAEEIKKLLEDFKNWKVVWCAMKWGTKAFRFKDWMLEEYNHQDGCYSIMCSSSYCRCSN